MKTLVLLFALLFPATCEACPPAFYSYSLAYPIQATTYYVPAPTVITYAAPACATPLPARIDPPVAYQAPATEVTTPPVTYGVGAYATYPSTFGYGVGAYGFSGFGYGYTDITKGCSYFQKET